MIDWERVVADLRQVGWSTDALGEEVGYKDGSALRQWGKGKRSVTFEIGARLLIVHQRTTSNPIPYTQAPTEDSAVVVLRIAGA